MTQSKLSLTRAVANHRGAFLTSLVTGAVLMLGVRSLFVGADGSLTMAEAATATDHHAEPGHEGHAHDAAPTAPEDEGHGSHGKKKDGDAHDGHGAGDGADQENSGEKKKHDGDAEEEAKFVPVLLDLANSACPVMGGDVNGKTFTEWNGLRVGHCCPGCSKRFLANPEALLDEVAPDWRAAAAAVKAVGEAKGAAQEEALTKLEKKWKVVRKPAAERSE